MPPPFPPLKHWSHGNWHTLLCLWVNTPSYYVRNKATVILNIQITYQMSCDQEICNMYYAFRQNCGQGTLSMLYNSFISKFPVQSPRSICRQVVEKQVTLPGFFWRYEHLRPAHKTMANYCIINFPGNYRQPTKAGIIETSYTGYATNF